MKLKFRYWMGVLVVIYLLSANQSAWTQRRRIGGPLRTTIPEDIGITRERTPNRRMLKASYQQVQKDVGRLSELSMELKQEVNSSDENVLSLSGLKKAEEIEKLAKKIQSRMKNL